MGRGNPPAGASGWRAVGVGSFGEFGNRSVVGGGVMGSRRLLVFLTAWACRAAAPLAAAADSGAAPAPAAAVLGESGGTRPAMPSIIGRYEADAGSLRRAWPAGPSPARSDRLRRFQRDWLAALEGIDYDTLDRPGKVDYLLLRNHVGHELAQIDRQDAQAAEVAPLLPFSASIHDLDDARRRLEPVDPAAAAALLTTLDRRIMDARKAAAGDGEAPKAEAKDEPAKGDKPAPEVRKSRLATAVAARAGRQASQLRTALASWFNFSNNYDPLFIWWVAEPYKAVDKTLGDYATLLRETLGGVKPDDDGAITGEPIGRQALTAELAAAMIPYSPEELIALADREFAWCEAEMRKASREMGLGDDWKKALEVVKSHHVEPGKQPALIRDLALEAIRFVDDHDLVTIPPLARETWRMEMMSPQRQLVTPFFTGGEVISVSYPTAGMTQEQKLMTMRGNNIHFSRATVYHELIPGHHLQLFTADRERPYRALFRTPFLVEGWALYWELLFWDMDFARSPEDRVGMLFWRMHRCARIHFSLRFHLGQMTAAECVDYLVDRVGHERDNAAGEVRRSFNGSYGPLYQAAYLLGALQVRGLRGEMVGPGKMTDRQFHDAVLRENAIPVELIRASMAALDPPRDFKTAWRFLGDAPADVPKAGEDR